MDAPFVYLSVFTLLSVLLSCGCNSTETVNLLEVVGSTLTFPGSVKEKGFLSFGPKVIASVSKGEFEIEEDVYSNRLHWSSSGRFTLSDLQKTDSGVYSIDSKKGNVFTKYYNVKVYDPVSAPVVSCVNSSSDGLSLQCSVNKSEQTSLSWLRGDRTVEQSLSGVLLLSVRQQDYSSTYTCVARNPADNNNITVDIFKLCNITETRGNGNEPESTNYVPFLILLAVVPVILGALVCFILRKRFKKEQPLQTQDSVQYAQINFQKRKANETQNSAASSGSTPRPPMDSVYDEIQAHRMATYSNCGGEMT